MSINPKTIEDFHTLAEAGILQGLFPGIDGDDYHRALPGVSKTDIEAAALSLANMIQRKGLVENDSEALLLGKMFHARVEHHENLDRFREQFLVMPKFEGEGSRKAKAEWIKANAGRTLMDQDQVDQVEAMFRGLMAHPTSAAIVRAPGFYEETVIWIDPDTGVLCKCRPDKRITDFLGGPLVVDWKSISPFSKKEISESIYDHNYHVSAAFTMDGLRAVGIDPGAYVFAFVEKKAPHRVLCVTADEFDVDLGRRKYKRVLAQIAEAQRTKIWPGFVNLGMPEWARQREMEQLSA